MQTNPLVSIVTIVYNGVSHLEETIQSVFNQSYAPIEYIIIDGGSTDGSVELIKKYSDRLAYWVSEKDKGISDAFNKGVLRATGEIIGLINADDWYEPDAVLKVVENIGENDIAYGDLRFFRQGVFQFVQAGDHRRIVQEMTLNHPTVFVKKHVYQDAGIFNLNYKCAMDYELMLRFYKKGYTFVRIPAPLANMRWEGMSDKNWLLGCKEVKRAKDHYYPENKIRNFLYYYKHRTAIALPKFLEKTPFSGLVKAYRSGFSKQKKTYR